MAKRRVIFKKDLSLFQSSKCSRKCSQKIRESSDCNLKFFLFVTLHRSRAEAEPGFRQAEPDSEIGSVSAGALIRPVDIKDRKQPLVERDVGEPEQGVGEEVEVVLDHLNHDPVLKKD